jgi:hypothetical protein
MYMYVTIICVHMYVYLCDYYLCTYVFMYIYVTIYLQIYVRLFVNFFLFVWIQMIEEGYPVPIRGPMREKYKNFVYTK